jgi:DNA sulfur modification protein DndC
MAEATKTKDSRPSAFGGVGLAKTVKALGDEIRELYMADAVPWVVGYSGGKDSSAVLQLVWLAIRELPAEQRTKPIHVITTDTLVEQPMVAAWVDTSQARMREAAQAQGLPITPHKLTPEIEDSFWVNLIGKGYPAPRLKFRWCTERLKIKPSNKFIREVVRSSGEAILVLGTRKAESALRAANMARCFRRLGAA